MYNPNNLKEIVFPHIIHGNMLGGKKYDWNSCEGESKPIGAFGHTRTSTYTTNSFYGGRCLRMKLIKEFGIYACQSKDDLTQIIGFYLHDPKLVTDTGKQVIEEALPNNTVAYIWHEDIKKQSVDKKWAAKVKEEAKKIGIDENIISSAAVATLESLVKAERFEIEQRKKNEPIVIEKQPEIPVTDIAEPKKSDSNAKKVINPSKSVAKSVGAKAV